MNEKIVALIQSRMSSKRLPGKALLPLKGVPLIMRVVERVEQVADIDTVVVATSQDASDDALVAALNGAQKKVFRGDLDNVQKRFFDAATHYKADIIIRVTGDNPLIEPILIDRLIVSWKKERREYMACDRCIPGVGAELFTMRAFKKAVHLTCSAYGREHVTPAFYQNETLFSIKRVYVEDYLAEKSLSLTVDQREDYEKIAEVYERFYNNNFISNKEVIAYLKKKSAIVENS